MGSHVDPEIISTLVDRIEALEDICGISALPEPIHADGPTPYGEEFALLQQIRAMNPEALQRFALDQALKVAELQQSVATLIVGL